MNLLALDTSTDFASVALSHGEHLNSLEQSSVRQHAQQLLPMIQQLLDQAELSLSRLDGIVFDSGPGSFTGLRIACSMAKALAYAHDLPVYSVSSLDAIAYQARLQMASEQQSIGIVAILDARMNEVYWAYYPPDSLRSENGMSVTPASLVSVPEGCRFVVAGLGLDTHESQWSAAFKTASQAYYPIAPSAKALIERVQLGGIPMMHAADVLPIYVRNTVTQTGGPHG
jgi:tRNA threonylcarbamoyladenosine biosynthesis protein TsaB